MGFFRVTGTPRRLYGVSSMLSEEIIFVSFEVKELLLSYCNLSLVMFAMGGLTFKGCLRGT